MNNTQKFLYDQLNNKMKNYKKENKNNVINEYVNK